MITVAVPSLDSCLRAVADFAGPDLWVVVTGGPEPHIGCCCMAIPRPSLTGDGHESATVSTLNVTGHKDDAVAAHFAAALAAHFACRVAISCGIHFHQPAPDAIRQVVRDSEMLLEALTTALEKIHPTDS